jgi:hypothetical protein
MKWGTVYRNKTEQRPRPYVAVTADPYLAHWPNVLLARASLHTTSRNSTNSDRRKDGQIPLGEAAVVYADRFDRNFYPTTNNMRLSLVQASSIINVDKNDLLNPRWFSIIEVVPSPYIVPLQAELRTAIRGMNRPPVIVPSKQPAWVSSLAQGSVLEIAGIISSNPSSGQLFVVCSHETVHKYYNFSNVLLLPVVDWSASDVLGRYAFYDLLTLNPYYMPNVTSQPVARLLPEELQLVLDQVEAIMIGGTP